MATDVSMPMVVLFLEGTGGREVFHRLASSLQRGGRRVQLFVKAGRTGRPAPRDEMSSLLPDRLGPPMAF